MTIPPGVTIWLEGLPGSGKTTLSDMLASFFRQAGYQVETLDGDEVRRGLSPDLGFKRSDREVHAHRVAYVARLLTRNGVIVLVSLITPYETSRKDARSLIGDRMVEVWLRCPLEVCQARDPKGLYRKAREGGLKGMTGVDDPFENPTSPELILDSDQLSKEECIRRILHLLQDKGLLRDVPSA